MAEEKKKEEKGHEGHGYNMGPETQLVYECAVCENTFDHPGMCQACHTLLKKKGG